MKRRILLLTFPLFLLFISQVKAQVDVTATAGTLNASYPTLKDAFDAINAGTHQGTITIGISGNTTETAPAVLNASGSGSASYLGVTISPTGGAARTISGAIAAGSPLLDLNGADNVLIDGLNTGGNSLTIANTTVSSTSGTSTIRFQADATSNTITRTSIQGSSTMTTTTNGGTIYFAAGAISTGSDNNTISFCDIGPAGANLPAKAIYGNGTTTSSNHFNSNITITNCNIFDYFHATSISNAIYVSSGNTDWSITNNKFYQTAPRTQTTGANHDIIFLNNTTGVNFKVNQNTIGFASSGGTGVYSLTGLASTKIRCIYFNVGTTVASEANDNLISGITMTGPMTGTSTTAVFLGIFTNTSGLTDYRRNTLGSLDGSSSITINSSAASTGEINCLYNFTSSPGSNAIEDNNIGSIIYNNSAAGGATIMGIRFNSIGTHTLNVTGNTIGTALGPLTSNPTGSTAGQVVGIQAQAGVHNIIDNSISYLSGTAGNTGTGTSSSMAGIIVLSSGAGSTISQNTIHTISNSHASANVTVAGIIVAGATTGTNVVSRNCINSLVTNSSGATATINGISTSSGTTTYMNNMIRLGIDATGTDITAAVNINGVLETGGTNNFLHNSIYIGGTATLAGAGNTFGFNSSVTTNNRNYVNNIFFNARSSGGASTGKNYAIKVGGTTPNPTGLTSNFNDLLVTGLNSFVGLFNSIDQMTLADWRTATGQDQYSFSGDPQFINPTGTSATVDLHISGAMATPIEAGGANIAFVSDDYDGQTRASLSPSDIGADAGNFMVMDLSPPGIFVTPVTSKCGTDDILIAGVAISDASGVPTMGALAPRIYYRKGMGSWFSNAGMLASGTATNGVWNFTIIAADMGGLAHGDMVSYYIVAQDVSLPTPFLSSNPGGAVASDVNTVTTPPAVLFTATVTGDLSGTYTVGVGGNYTTLTAAVSDFNTKCISGPVVFNLIDATYPSETFPIAINAILGQGPSNTLTIKPAMGNAATISGSSSNCIIRLNGTDYVTIDGSNSGGSDRSLTISNTSTGTNTAVICVSSLGTGAGATNNTIKNCNIAAGSNTVTSTFGIHVAGTTISTSTTGNDNDNLEISNNAFSKSHYGVYAAAATAGPNDNLKILNNEVGSSAGATEQIGKFGLHVVQARNAMISENHIFNIINNLSNNPIGIFLGTGVENTLVYGNNIHSFDYTGASGYGSRGIDINSSATSNISIINNFITDIKGDGWSSFTSDATVGIRLQSSTGMVNIYNNTINLFGSITRAAATADRSAALYVPTGSTNIRVKNNIFVNTLENTTGVATAYAIATDGTAGVFATIDNNDYVVGGPEGVLGFLTSNRTTLADWQTATGQDANSISVVPVFTSPTDLHLVLASNPGLNATGMPLMDVPVDIDGETRNPTAPDVGADEMILCAVTIDDVVVTNTCTGLQEGTISITASCVDCTGSLEYSIDNGMTWQPGSDFTNLPDGGYDIIVRDDANTACSFTYDLNPVLVEELANPDVFAGSNSPLCEGDTLFLTETGGDATSWSWTGPNMFSSSIQNPFTPSATIGLTGSYTVVITDDNGCTNSQMIMVTVNSNPVASEMHVEPSTCVDLDGSIDLTVVGNTPISVDWTGPNGFSSLMEDIAMLGVGSYTAVVTDVNGCTDMLTVPLNGPGGCEICPTITTLSSSISPVCAGVNTTLQATGLADMGITYGIIFKYSTTPLADPYVGGTVIATLPNGMLLGGGTSAQTTTSFIAGTYNLYAILTPTPTDSECRPVATTSLTVNPLPTVFTVTGGGAYCDGGNGVAVGLNGSQTGVNYQLQIGGMNTGMPVPGTGSSISFGAQTTGGTYTVVAIDAMTMCSAAMTGSVMITVNPLPTLFTVTGGGAFCSGGVGVPVGLNGSQTGISYQLLLNGSNSGAPVVGTGSAISFGNRTGAGTYTVVATNTTTMCMATMNGSVMITVNPLPTLFTVTGGGAFCSGGAGVPVGLNGSQTGVNYQLRLNGVNTGAPVAGTGNAINFGTLTAAGTYTVVATNATTMCTNTMTGSVIITVNPLPTLFTVNGGGAYCIGENGAIVGLSGSQTGVNYQLRLNGVNTGAPVPGTGNAISFGAQAAVGTYTVVATNATTMCTATMTGSVAVSTTNCNIQITDPCSCRNNATTLTNGQFNETVTVIGPSGQPWTVSAVTGLFLSSSPNPPATPLPIPIGTTLTESPLGGGLSNFIITGVHVDAIGYTISVTNGRIILTIGNTCSYPNPSFSLPVGPFCINSPIINLTGTPGDANIISQTFFVNGNPTAVINPATLGLGSHTVTYTVNGGLPKASGPADPGCIQSVSATINIAASQSNVTCNDNVQVSLDENCEALILPDMVLEGTYACFDDYRVDLYNGTRLIATSPVLTGANIGQNITAKITHIPSGNFCWGHITVEDKWRPSFICPTAPVTIDCTQDPDDVPPPVATDNCSNFLTVNLIDETTSGDDCGIVTITRTFLATDIAGNTSDPCTQVIIINQSLVTFPDDITWTCEQYAAYNNVVTPTPLHSCIRDNAAIMDLADYCCIADSDGDDVIGVAPYQGASWWTDGEDLDVTLDPRYDDNIDNPLNDPVPGQCGTPTAETDSETGVCNLSLFVGCPYMQACTIPGTHIPTIIDVPVYQTPGPGGLPIRGLEDADVLALTGSGVPNVLGSSGCNYIVTWHDTKLEACEGVDTSIVFKILRTWTVLNWCTGQILTDIQIIKVIDKKAPAIVFNDDDNNNGVPDENQTNETYGDGDGFDDLLEANEILTVSGHDDCGSHGLLDVPVITDNCTGIDEIRVFTPVGEALPVFNGGTLIGFRIPPPFLPLGVHNISYQATDGCGNRTTAIKRVQVIDGIPPVPICREVTQVALSTGVDGLTSVPASFFDEGSYDNCGPVYFKVLKMEEGTCDDANRDKPNETREWFDDDVKFCCSDIQYDANGNPIPIIVILRVYDTDPGPGAIPTVRSNANNPNNLSHNGSASALNNNRYNDCMIQVLVEDKTRPVCTPPHDIWTTCAEIPANVDLSDTTVLQSLFGNAVATDNCDVRTIEQNPTVDVDLCGVGQVIRNFRARDISGNLSLGICRQVINIMQVTSYEIDIPGDFEDECTDVSPDTLVYREFGCDLLAVNVEDREFLATGGECKKIFRTYSIINWCEYDGFSAPVVLVRRDLNRDGLVGDGFTPSHPSSRFRSNYRVISNGDFIYLNSINDPVTRIAASTGYYTYEQHIKIYDDTAPVLTDTLSGPFCGGELDEDPCTGFVNILPSIVETCTGVTITWQLDVFNDGSYDLTGNNALQGRVALGSHRVRFRVADECGNISQIDIPFTVIDCKAPTPVCHNGLSVNLMPTGMVEIWAVDFDASSFDYCYPIEFRINRIEDRNGDGFITSADYLTTPPASDSIVARCKDVGVLYVQLWVHELSSDGVNDWDFCVSFIEVQDNNNVCNGSRAIGGKIANELNTPVSDVTVRLNTGRTAMTDNTGEYMFGNLFPGADYTVAPSRNDDHVNGVSTFDLVQISKHILNVQFLDSPYKIIAADANNSRTVTTLDLVALRKLILRVEDYLPNNTSWRFVDKNYIFLDPAKPFQHVFPEVKNFNNLGNDQLTTEFVAIKVGDVNGSARANSFTSTGNRTFSGDLAFNVKDHSAKAGEDFTVTFVPDQNVQGLQFTLSYDTDKAELINIEDGIATEAANFHVIANKGIITSSWNDNREISGQEMFRLVFRAKADIRVSELVKINSLFTPAEAYNLQGELLGINLKFGEGSIQASDFELYQNLPNPFREETVIGFNLPEATSATITITDVTGQVLRAIKGNYGKGYNQVIVKNSELPVSGVLMYEIKTDLYKATRKMVVLK